jgi:hypothetical protein
VLTSAADTSSSSSSHHRDMQAMSISPFSEHLQVINIHVSALINGVPVCPADSHQDTRLAAAEAADNAADDVRTAVGSSQTAADANAPAAPAPEQAARDTGAAPASDDERAPSDVSDLEAPPDVASPDAVLPLPEAQQPSGQHANSTSVSRLSPAYSRQSTGGSSGWTSDFERSAAPMESSGLGDAGTSTLPVTQSLSYRCTAHGVDVVLQVFFK